MKIAFILIFSAVLAAGIGVITDFINQINKHEIRNKKQR